MSHSFFSLTNVVILIMYIVINTKNRMMKKLLSFIVAIVLTITLAAQNNTISITYNDSIATVVVSDNIAQYITPTISGAHVSIAQSSDVPTEIIYTLSGTSNDGEFYMSTLFYRYPNDYNHGIGSLYALQHNITKCFR